MLNPNRKKQIFKPVFPQDPVGAEFCKWFWTSSRGWHWISSDLPAPREKATWTTEPFPIQPDELWRGHQDLSSLIGVGFKKLTRYLALDIDRGSAFHPLNNPEKFKQLLTILQSIGLVGAVVTRSSGSEGLHVYFPFSKPISSFGVACAVKWTLFDHGILLGSGQLELFPNAKSYGANGNIVNYKCHRLPLQPGSDSFLLDGMLEPYSDEVADLLDEFNTAAYKQDLKLLKPVMDASRERQARSRSFGQRRNSAEKWRSHLENRKNTGWTGFSQTNSLIKDIATYGRVFIGLDGLKLIEYTMQSATSAPGYEQFCRHQHEIWLRAADWSRCVEAYYWPYGSEPSREGTYAEHFHRDYDNDCPRPENNIVGFAERRSGEAKERIRQAVAHLESSDNLPDTATARSYAIIATSKQLTGTGISQTTLHKPKYLALWHPDHYNPLVESCVIDCPEQVSADLTGQNYPMEPDPWLEPESPELSPQPVLAENYTSTPYMKGLCLPLASDAPQAQSDAPDSESDSNLLTDAPDSSESENLLKSDLELTHKESLCQGFSGAVDFDDNFSLSVEISGMTDSRHLPTAPLPRSGGSEYPDREPTLAPPVPTEPAAPSDFRQVAMLRVQALAHAQKVVKQQRLAAGRFIKGPELKHLERVAKYQFYWESGSPQLRAEARAWAAANPGALPEALLAEEAAAAAPTPAPSPQKPAAPTTRALVMADPHAPTQAEYEAKAPNLTEPAAPPNAATPTPPADPPADDLSLSPTTRQSDCATQDQTNPTAPSTKFEEAIAAANNTAPATEIAEAIAPTPADPEAKAPNPEQERCTPEVNQKADLAERSANSPPSRACEAQAKAPTEANTVKPPLPWNSERIKPHFDLPEPFRFGQRVMYEGQEYRILVPGYPRSMLSGMKFSVPNEWIEPLED